MHAKMAYYTNSNQIKEVMTNIADVPVKTLEKIPKEWWSDLICTFLIIFSGIERLVPIGWDVRLMQ